MGIPSCLGTHPFQLVNVAEASAAYGLHSTHLQGGLNVEACGLSSIRDGSSAVKGDAAAAKMAQLLLFQQKQWQQQ